MEQIDPQLAQRVWERVRGGQDPQDPARDLQAMVLAAGADRSACAQLARTFKSEPLLKILIRDCEQTAACLRGLHKLLTGQPPHPGRPSREEGSARELLVRCHSRTLTCLELCQRWQVHPRCGAALTVLAGRLRERCCLLARLIDKI